MSNLLHTKCRVYTYLLASMSCNIFCLVEQESHEYFLWVWLIRNHQNWFTSIYFFSWWEQRLVEDIQFSHDNVFLAEKPTAILLAYSAEAGHNARRFGRCGGGATVAFFLSIIVVIIIEFRCRNSGSTRGKGLGTGSTSVLARLILVEADASAIAAALGEHPLCPGWEAQSVYGTTGTFWWLRR